MTSPGKIQAGAAAIALTLEDDEFKKDWAQLRSGLSKITGVLNKVGIAAGAMGSAITFGFSQMVRVTANAETGFRRFALIFGENADLMTSKLTGLSSHTGIAMTALKTQASAFGAIFSELGTALDAERFTTAVAKAQKAVVDLSGVAGIGMEEAADRIKSALTSTGESVDQFGFNLRQAEINAELQRIGINKNVRQLSELEKQLVKIQIIQKSIERGQLDFANMSSTLNAKLTILRSNLQELWINLSQLALAVSKVVATILNAFVRLANWGPFRYLTIGFGAIVSILGPLLLLVATGAFLFSALSKALIWTVVSTKALAAAGATLIPMMKTVNGLTLIGAFLWGKLTAAILTATAATKAFIAAYGGVLLRLGAIGVAAFGITQASRGITAAALGPSPDQLTMTQAQKRLDQLWWTKYGPIGALLSPYIRKLHKRVQKAQARMAIRAQAPRAAMTQAVLGSRLIAQQIAYGTGVSTPAEETAKNVSHLAEIADSVLGEDGSSIRTTAGS